MQWEDYSGETLSLYIYDLQTQGDQTIQLTAGGSPFVIQQTGRDDLMKPMRPTTASISVVCNYQDMFDLTDNNRFRVILKRGVDVIWMGWLTADVLDQTFSSTNDELTYNAVDDLGHLESVNMAAHDTAVTLREIFQECIDSFINKGEGYATQYIHIGNAFPVVSNLDNTFGISTATGKWAYTNDNDDEVSMDSLYSIVSEFMTLFGCTLFSNGKDWFIISPADTKISSGVEMSSALSFANVTFSDYVQKAINSVHPTGSHGIVIYNPVNDISMRAGGDSLGKILPVVAPAQMKFLKSLIADEPYYMYPGSTAISPGQKISWKVVQYATSANKEIQMFRYETSQVDGVFAVGDAVSEDITDVDTQGKKNILWRYGACYLKEDYYNTGTSEDEGSGSDVGGSKYNYDFHQRLYLLNSELVGNTNGHHYYLGDFTVDDMPAAGGGTTYITMPTELYEEITRRLVQTFNKPLVAIRNMDGFNATQGGICISGNMWYGVEPTNSLHPEINQRGPVLTRRYDCQYIMICSLSIGGRYWYNGGTHKEKGYFYILRDDIDAPSSPTTFYTFRNTKTLLQNYICEGYSIPIADVSAAGRVEFCIYYIGAFEMSQDSRGYYKGVVHSNGYGIVENLEIEYCPPLDGEYNEVDVEIKKKAVKTGGVGSLEIDTPLCSGEVSADNSGTLYLKGKLGKMTAVDSPAAQYPEQITFDRAKGIYQKEQVMIELNHEQLGAVNPTERLVDNDGNTLALHYIEEQDVTTNTGNIVYIRK